MGDEVDDGCCLHAVNVCLRLFGIKDAVITKQYMADASRAYQQGPLATTTALVTDGGAATMDLAVSILSEHGIRCQSAAKEFASSRGLRRRPTKMHVLLNAREGIFLVETNCLPARAHAYVVQKTGKYKSYVYSSDIPKRRVGNRSLKRLFSTKTKVHRMRSLLLLTRSEPQVC